MYLNSNKHTKIHTHAQTNTIHEKDIFSSFNFRYICLQMSDVAAKCVVKLAVDTRWCWWSVAATLLLTASFAYRSVWHIPRQSIHLPSSTRGLLLFFFLLIRFHHFVWLPDSSTDIYVCVCVCTLMNVIANTEDLQSCHMVDGRVLLDQQRHWLWGFAVVDTLGGQAHVGCSFACDEDSHWGMNARDRGKCDKLNYCQLLPSICFTIENIKQMIVKEDH